MTYPVTVVDLPLTTSFRGLTRRQAVLWEGPAGWTEWSPFAEYDDQEAATWLLAAVEAATQPPPAPVRHEVPVNVIIPAMAPDAAALRVRKSGCTTAKVKVAHAGDSLDDDVARVAAVREALGPDGGLRVDANTGWSVPDAVEALAELAQFGLEYAEQPVAGVDGLRALKRELHRRGVQVPIAADESIRRSPDPLQVREVADVAILKVQPLGGITRCRELAHRLGLPVVVSSALDTSVGLRTGVALAASLPELPLACGLQTGTLFERDVTTRPLLPEAGRIAVRDVEVDALQAVAASPEVTRWWTQRLHRVAARFGSLEQLMGEAS